MVLQSCLLGNIGVHKLQVDAVGSMDSQLDTASDPSWGQVPSHPEAGHFRQSGPALWLELSADGYMRSSE